MSLLLIAHTVSKSTRKKSKGLPIDVSFYLIFFTHATSCTKSQGLPIDVPFYLILFTREALHTKSKGLPIEVPFYLILLIGAVL
jgi:hypothetical protein